MRFIHQASLNRFSAYGNSQDYSNGDIYRYDVDTWKKLVDEAASLDEVRALLGNEKLITINLGNVARSEQNPHGLMNTIEFRQHAGTLTPAATISYAEFCASFVERNFNMTEENFSKLFGGGRGTCRRKAFNGLNLVHEMNCSDMTKAYYKRLLTTADPIEALGIGEVLSEAKRIAEKPDKDAVSALAEMIRVNLETRARNYSQKLTRQKIEHKLRTGGYGQFNEQDLLELLPGDANIYVRQILMVTSTGNQSRPPSPNSSKKRHRA